MNNAILREDQECQHDEYCGFAATICREHGRINCCSIKDVAIQNMPLLKKVKERIERDKLRDTLYS